MATYVTINCVPCMELMMPFSINSNIIRLTMHSHKVCMINLLVHVQGIRNVK